MAERLSMPDALADALADIYGDLLRRRAIRLAAESDAQQQPRAMDSGQQQPDAQQQAAEAAQ